MKKSEVELYKNIKNLYKLKDVIRYNTRNVLYHENVATHCFNVAVISLYVCDMFNLTDDIRFQCLIKALLHDMPEIKYNDITHNVKEELGLRPLLKKYEDKFYEEEFPDYASLMNKEYAIIDDIVNYADALSVKQYIDNEIELGNLSPDIKKIQADTYIRLSKCKQTLENAIKKENNTHGTLA